MALILTPKTIQAKLLQTGNSRSFFTCKTVKVNSKVFTVHQPFTAQNIDFYKQKYAVNSVNSFSKKKFFFLM